MNPELRDWSGRLACALFPGRSDEVLSSLESLREFESSTLHSCMRLRYAEGHRACVCVCVLSASVNLEKSCLFHGPALACPSLRRM